MACPIQSCTLIEGKIFKQIVKQLNVCLLVTLFPVFPSDAHKNTLTHNESLISIKHCQIETTPTSKLYSLALN